MKKTLVAVAALATLSGAAFAQSSVTLYGKIDWTLQKRTQSTAGVKPAAANPGWEVNSAGLSGSRWGLKGTEDLGGGLKAIFDLQGGFNIDNGASAQGGTLFGRQAFAGLAGGFGTVTAGRQYTPLDTVWGTYDAQGYTTNSAMGYAWNGSNSTARGIHYDGGRLNNSIQYTTPAMGGFRASVMWAPGENNNPGVASAGSYIGASAGYANGPLGIDLAYESIRNRSVVASQLNGGAGVNSMLPAGFTPAIAANTTTRNWTLGASYDFGVAKLFGGYERGTFTGGSDDTGWMLGVGVPFGAFGLNVGYATEKNNVAGLAFDGRNRAIGAQLVYSLSKRTNVYVDMRTGKSRPAAAAAGAAVTKDNLFGVGMRHDF